MSDINRDADAQLWELPDDALVKTHEAASMLCKSVRTLEGWRLQGKGPAYCGGRPVTYPLHALRSFKMAQTVEPYA